MEGDYFYLGRKIVKWPVSVDYVYNVVLYTC